MFTVKTRVFGKAADGRTVLLYTPGMVISDDDARRAGLLAGKPKAEKPARGVTVTDKSKAKGETSEPEAPKPLERMKLAELQEVCAEESIDPDGANTRAEYIAVIEAARAKKAEDQAADGDGGGDGAGD